MKIGAKEMKKAYKDVKLDQIDVCKLYPAKLNSYSSQSRAFIIVLRCHKNNTKTSSNYS